MVLAMMKKMLDGITQFGLVSSSNTVKNELIQGYCRKVTELLEYLKPVLSENVSSEVSPQGQQSKVLEELDVCVNEATELVASLQPVMSKLYFVLQMETIIKRICSLSLELCKALCSLLHSPEISSTARCIEKFEEVHHEQISPVIEEVLRDQKERNMPRPEQLDKISNFFSLSSNQELLMEAVALEKFKVKAVRGEIHVELETVDNMITLISYMHDSFVKVHQLHSIDGKPIPADFCCPLSLQMMSDPVIVASGQTYERAFIKKWIDEGFNVCPKTRQPLGRTNLTPNYTVKALIANWCETNNIKLPDPAKSMNLTPPLINQTNASSNDCAAVDSSHLQKVKFPRSPESNRSMLTSQVNLYSSSGAQQETHTSERPTSHNQNLSGGSSSPVVNGHEKNFNTDDNNRFSERSENSSSQTYNEQKTQPQSLRDIEQFQGHKHAASASGSISSSEHLQGPANANIASRASSDVAHVGSDGSGEVVQDVPAASIPQREPEFAAKLGEARTRTQNLWRRPSVPRLIPSQSTESRPDLSGVELQVRKLVEDLKSDSVDVQRAATEELRLLAKHNMENRIVIANCGAISLLVGLLHSTDAKIQENAVTALLNLSINDNNKTAIANADAIDPLIHVLETGNPEAKENSAATLFSLSVVEENKVRIGRSGAIKPLVDLLGNGTPRGKKDAATALFNLSIFHENKVRIVQAGAVKHLVELMDPATGMVDKAVAVLANLATIPEGRTAIGHAGGIPLLVEVVELGSARGKENAAAALLQLCTNSNRFCSLVLQEGAVPPLVALSQSGTPRAKEKAQALLSYFRNQRHGNTGRG